jgi:hypothetical protein
VEQGLTDPAGIAAVNAIALRTALVRMRTIFGDLETTQ